MSIRLLKAGYRRVAIEASRPAEDAHRRPGAIACRPRAACRRS